MIDWKQVTLLRDEVGEEDFADVVDIFIEEVSAAVENLRNRAQTDTLGAELHAVKGSALNLGFTEFSKLCQIGETQAAQGKADQISLLPIIKCYNASKEAFLDGLAQAR